MTSRRVRGISSGAALDRVGASIALDGSRNPSDNGLGGDLPIEDMPGDETTRLRPGITEVLLAVWPFESGEGETPGVVGRAGASASAMPGDGFVIGW